MIHIRSAEGKAMSLLLISILLFCFSNLRVFSLYGVTYLIAVAVLCRLTAGGSHCSFAPDAAGDTTGSTRVAVVTGASSGVGYAVSKELVCSGWKVIAAGPDVQRLLVARRSIQNEMRKKQNKKNSVGEFLVLDRLDLGDEESIRFFAQKVLENERALPVCLLVNAAGTLRTNLAFCSPTSRWWCVESMLAINAVGPMLLSSLLFPVLQRTAESRGKASRIVNVASSCHSFLSVSAAADPLAMIAGLCSARAAGLGRDINSTVRPLLFGDSFTVASQAVPRGGGLVSFSGWRCVNYYGLSKLCTIWNTYILQQEADQLSRLADGTPKILVASTHPGVICTHLYRDLFPTWVLDRIFYYPSLAVGKTLRESANSTLLAIQEDDARFIRSGYYLCDGDHSHGGFPFLSSHARNTNAIERYKTWLSLLGTAS